MVLACYNQEGICETRDEVDWSTLWFFSESNEYLCSIHPIHCFENDKNGEEGFFTHSTTLNHTLPELSFGFIENGERFEEKGSVEQRETFLVFSR